MLDSTIVPVAAVGLDLLLGAGTSIMTTWIGTSGKLLAKVRDQQSDIRSSESPEVQSPKSGASDRENRSGRIDIRANWHECWPRGERRSLRACVTVLLGLVVLAGCSTAP